MGVRSAVTDVATWAIPVAIAAMATGCGGDSGSGPEDEVRANIDILASVIVWVSDGGGTMTREFEMRGHEIASGREVSLGPGAVFRWSNDRSRVAISRETVELVSLRDGSVVKTEIAGNPRVWSPDDRFLVISGANVVLDTSTLATTPLAEMGPYDATEYTAAGNLLVRDDTLCRPDGTSCVELPGVECRRSPDDLTFACESDLVVSFQDLAGTEQHRWDVTGTHGGLTYGQWFAEAGEARFHTTRRVGTDRQVWIGAPGAPLLLDTFPDRDPILDQSPDQARIALSRAGQLSIFNIDGSERVDYPFLGRPSPYWSPDASRLALVDMDTETISLLVPGAASPTPLKSFPGATYVVEETWSSSGSHFSTVIDGVVVACAADGATCVDLGIGEPVWAGDLLVINNEDTGVVRIAPDGSDPVPLFEGKPVRVLEVR